MRPIFHLIFYWLLGAPAVFGQRDPWHSFYRQCPQLVNPAAVDRWFFMQRKYPDLPNLLSAGGQWQLVGFEGAPLTAFAAGEFLPPGPDALRVGGQVLYDRMDAFLAVSAAGNLTARIETGTDGRLYLGLSPGLFRRWVDVQRLIFASPNDPNLPEIERKQLGFSLGSGLFFRQERQFYVGLSTPDATRLGRERGSHLDFIFGKYVARDGDIKQDVFWELNTWLRWQPGVRFRQIKGWNSLSADVNLRQYFPEKFWWGLGLATNGLATLELGLARRHEARINEQTKSKLLRLGATVSYPVWYRLAQPSGGWWSFGLTTGWAFAKKED